MSNPTLQVDGYIRKVARWRDVLQALRAIVLDSPLVEDIKWRAPCYTLNNANVVMLVRFKDRCVMMFVKGGLMTDPVGILLKPGPNTQTTRIINFTDTRQVTVLQPVLKSYIREAIALEKAGVKPSPKSAPKIAIPAELQERFDAVPRLKAAFTALTPGRQRAYLLHFTSAKQSTTRASRIAKCEQNILDGLGLDDR